ncbi:hypothetical protein [Ruegeria halocynthiae]|uniref:hypothetical protein n=1 Tax=Ruegeria halocynthiae TaxID=985054 RepID=UPI000568C470|nr:hypothetical protein [Ruegeria halocynthiae]
MSSPAIKLSPERHAQVKAIGAALGGLSYAETVGYMVNCEIAKGTIPPGIQGVNLVAGNTGILIGLDDQPPVPFSKDGVADLAKTLRAFVDGDEKAQKLVNMQHNYLIERKGNGVKLTIPFAGKVTKSFPCDVARDLAELLAA